MRRADIDTVLEFNAAINAHDLERLTGLMSPDHRFVDSAGDVVDGLGACRDAWTSFFEAFPDYRNIVSETRLVTPGHVVVVGRSECSFAPLRGPAVWHALVHDGAVVEWRVDEHAE